MTANKAADIKQWIKSMGFKLFKSHSMKNHSRKIKYYTLGSFGIYEELKLSKSAPAKASIEKFISWTPWGDDMEIHSVKELSDAYEKFQQYNPSVVLN